MDIKRGSGGNLFAEVVALHLVVVGSGMADCVEELSPEYLSNERHWRPRVACSVLQNLHFGKHSHSLASVSAIHSTAMFRKRENSDTSQGFDNNNAVASQVSRGGCCIATLYTSQNGASCARCYPMTYACYIYERMPTGRLHDLLLLVGNRTAELRRSQT